MCVYGAFIINELSPHGVSTLIGGHVIAIIRSVGLCVSDTDVDQNRRGYRDVYNGPICAEHMAVEHARRDTSPAPSVTIAPHPFNHKSLQNISF